MSYALRNSIILAVLLVVVSAVGVYWIWLRQDDEKKVLQERREELKGELEIINSVLAIYDAAQEQLDRYKTRWQNRGQIVPGSDDPAATLAYLYDLMELRNVSVNFDFFAKGRVDEEGHSFNMYALEGEGKFENLYGFIWHLEHGRRFHAVDHVQMDHREGELSGKRDWVKFKMVFRTYFEPGSRVEGLQPLEMPARPPLLAHSPFRPLITQALPRNNLGLFETDGAQLQGLGKDLAYLVDRQGQMHLLREGDRVFMGRLAKIDLEGNQVEFVLNKGGIWERLKLKVGIDGQNSE